MDDAATAGYDGNADDGVIMRPESGGGQADGGGEGDSDSCLALSRREAMLLPAETGYRSRPVPVIDEPPPPAPYAMRYEDDDGVGGYDG